MEMRSPVPPHPPRAPGPPSAPPTTRSRSAPPTMRSRKMEPAEQSGTTGQASPRGNDWEVVQLTASNYGPARSEPSDEEQEYGTKRDDSAAAALLMSGHFSLPRNEAESLFKGDRSKERQEERGSQYAVSDTGDDDRYKENLKDDGLDRIPSYDKGKSLSLVDMESDDDNALRGATLAGEDPVTFSSSGYGVAVVAEKELSWSATESRTTEEKTEDPTLQNVDTVTDSSKIAAPGEERWRSPADNLSNFQDLPMKFPQCGSQASAHRDSSGQGENIISISSSSSASDSAGDISTSDDDHEAHAVQSRILKNGTLSTSKPNFKIECSIQQEQQLSSK